MQNEAELREASLAIRIPDPEPEHDRRLVAAVGGLVDQVVDRILLSPDRITSAAEGKRAMAGDDDTEAFTDTLQRIAVIATLSKDECWALAEVPNDPARWKAAAGKSMELAQKDARWECERAFATCQVALTFCADGTKWP